MKNLFRLFAVASSLALATNISHAGLITEALNNGDFQQTTIARNTFANISNIAPPWSFFGGTGLVNGNGGLSVWPGTGASSSTQYADIGNGSTGRVEQNFTVPAGHAIRFAGWSSNTAAGFSAPFIVKVIDLSNPSVVAFAATDTARGSSGFLGRFGGWTRRGVNAQPNTFGPGNYQIEFAGTGGGSTADVLIDNVSVILEAADPNIRANGLAYGSTLVGTRKTGNVNVTNTGDAFSTLTGTIGDSSNAEIQPDGGVTSFSLGAGESQFRTFKYAPKSRGLDSTDVPIESNATTGVVHLTGKGVAPVSQLTSPSPNSDHAGFTLVGTSKTVSIQIDNVGDGNLSGLPTSISNLRGVLSSGSGAFSLVGSSDLSLGDGKSRVVSYNYAPTQRRLDRVLLGAGFGNGSSDGKNDAHALRYGFNGTGVAPIRGASLSASSFGSVRVGTSGVISAGAANFGFGNLSGVGIDSNLRGEILLEPGTGEFSGGGSFSLADQRGTSFSFVYSPTDRGVDTRDLTFDFLNGSTDGQNNANSSTATLTGIGVGPEFGSSVPIGFGPGFGIDFGELLGGTSASRSLDISNITTDLGGDSLTGLTLLGFSFVGPHAGLFDLSGFTPGMLLSKGALASFNVIFNANGPAGRKRAALRFSTDQGAAFGQMGRNFFLRMQGNVVPEPSSLVLLGIGAVCLIGYRRKRRGLTATEQSSSTI